VQVVEKEVGCGGQEGGNHRPGVIRVGGVHRVVARKKVETGW